LAHRRSSDDSQHAAAAPPLACVALGGACAPAPTAVLALPPPARSTGASEQGPGSEGRPIWSRNASLSPRQCRPHHLAGYAVPWPGCRGGLQLQPRLVMAAGVCERTGGGPLRSQSVTSARATRVPAGPARPHLSRRRLYPAYRRLGLSPVCTLVCVRATHRKGRQCIAPGFSGIAPSCGLLHERR
jgi:hypothetical protein